jgi:GxxExxY protein
VQLFKTLHRVHFKLGPGFLRQVYHRATMVELREQGMAYRYIKRLPITYQGHLLGEQPACLIKVGDRILLAALSKVRASTCIMP